MTTIFSFPQPRCRSEWLYVAWRALICELGTSTPREVYSEPGAYLHRWCRDVPADL